MSIELMMPHAIRPSHPLSPPSPPSLDLSQHQVFSPVNQLLISSGQSIRASASALPVNIQGWFPLGLTGLIFLLSKRLLRVFSSSAVQKRQFFSAQPMNSMKRQNDMMEYYPGIKKNEIMPFVTPWTKLRGYHTKWSKSERERHDITYMSNLKKMIQMKL